MDIEYLREFVALGKILNISAAARTLHMAPSTLSKHLSAIEHDLGVALVFRTSTGIELAPAGCMLFEWASDAICAYDETVRNMRKSVKEQTSIIRVGGNMRNKRAAELAEAAITIVVRQHLPVMVELHTPGAFTEIGIGDPVDAALNDLLDVSILAVSERYEWDGFERRTLFRDPFALFVADNGPLAHRETVSLADLDARTVVRAAAYANYFARIEEACQLSGATVKMRTRTFHDTGSLFVARDQDDIFIIPQSTASRVIASQAVSGLVQLNLNDPNAYFEFCAVYRKQAGNPGIQIFVEALDAANAAAENMGIDAG